MRRAIVVLSVLLVLQLAVLTMQWGAGAENGSRASRLTPLFKSNPEQVAKIVIRDQNGKEITLVREDNGFVVASAAGYPVEGDRAGDFLRSLLALEPKGVVARSAKSHRGLGVADDAFEREIELYDASGGLLDHVLLGNAGGEFVRRAGEETVYRVEQRLGYRASTSPASWVDTQLVSFKLDDVKRARWLRGGAEGEAVLELERLAPADVAAADDKASKPRWIRLGEKGGELERFEAEGVMNALSHLRFQKPVAAETKPTFGLEPPAYRIEIELKSGEKIALEIGARTKEQGAFARLEGKPFVVELPRYAVDQLLGAPEKLKPKPPEQEEQAQAQNAAGDAGHPERASVEAATPSTQTTTAQPSAASATPKPAGSGDD